eukprot:scaffold2325_cov105-Isochrysis_galbana.AAC.3
MSRPFPRRRRASVRASAGGTLYSSPRGAGGVPGAGGGGGRRSSCPWDNLVNNLSLLIRREGDKGEKVRGSERDCALCYTTTTTTTTTLYMVHVKNF